MDPRAYFAEMQWDPKDPDPWLAMYLDQSLPMDEKAKAAFLKSQRRRTRRIALPLVQPLARLAIFGIKLGRTLLPGRWQSSWLLHRSIYVGLRLLVCPEANYVILRHFNLATEVLQFIADNVPGVRIEATRALRPQRLEDLLDDAFVIHDLNLYNFVIELSSKLAAQGRDMETTDRVDYSAITDEDVALCDLPDTWHNFVDLQTAIELYTPLYALFLTDPGFWRASSSLQLDETLAIYVSKILGDPRYMALVHNRHPMVPSSTLGAGFRLTLHGLDTEALHGQLRKLKREQRTTPGVEAASKSGPPR